MLKKQMVSVLLILATLLSISCSAFAVNSTPSSVPTAQTYTAQVYHATDVDEYGSNISEASEILADVPVSISQDIDSLNINLQIADTPVTVNATVLGKNLLGNMLYYDVTDISDETLDVMMLTYIENFSHSGVLAQEYCANHPDAENVLEIYLKVPNAEYREYYFIEIFDFTLDGFSENDSPECDVPSWFVREFLPVKSYVTEDESGVSPYATLHTTTHTFTHEFYRFSDLCTVGLVVQKTDDIGDVPCGNSDQWLHTLKITEKYTKCPSAPEYNRNNSDISLTNVYYEGSAAPNCAFQTATIGGVAQKTSIFAGALSATLSAGYGLFSVSLDLGTFLNPKPVKINDPFTGFDNTKDNCAKTIRVDFSQKYYLYDVGDYFQVAVNMRDFGNTTTASNYVICKWVMTATSLEVDEVINSDYVISGAYPVKVK